MSLYDLLAVLEEKIVKETGNKCTFQQMYAKRSALYYYDPDAVTSDSEEVFLTAHPSPIHLYNSIINLENYLKTTDPNLNA